MSEKGYISKGLKYECQQATWVFTKHISFEPIALQATLAHVHPVDNTVLHLLGQPQFAFLLPCP